MQFVKDLVDKDGVILKRKFTFNGHGYEITGTRSNGFHEPIMKSRDTLTRDDGQIVELTRHIMRDYFAGRLKNKLELDTDITIIKKSTHENQSNISKERSQSRGASSQKSKSHVRNRHK